MPDSLIATSTSSLAPPPQQVLRAVSDNGVLSNFAAKAPASWKALCSLTKLALECGMKEEARFSLLIDQQQLRRVLAAAEPAANKLLRLLQVGDSGPSYTGSRTTS